MIPFFANQAKADPMTITGSFTGTSWGEFDSNNDFGLNKTCNQQFGCTIALPVSGTFAYTIDPSDITTQKANGAGIQQTATVPVTVTLSVNNSPLYTFTGSNSDSERVYTNPTGSGDAWNLENTLQNEYISVIDTPSALDAFQGASLDGSFTSTIPSIMADSGSGAELPDGSYVNFYITSVEWVAPQTVPPTTSVPEPSTLAVFALGLIGLITVQQNYFKVRSSNHLSL